MEYGNPCHGSPAKASCADKLERVLRLIIHAAYLHSYPGARLEQVTGRHQLDIEFVNLPGGQGFRFCVRIDRLPRLRLLHIELPVRLCCDDRYRCKLDHFAFGDRCERKREAPHQRLAQGFAQGARYGEVEAVGADLYPHKTGTLDPRKDLRIRYQVSTDREPVQGGLQDRCEDKLRG